MEIIVTKIISQKIFGYIFNGQYVQNDQKGQSVQVKISHDKIVGCPSVGEVWRVQGPVVETKWGQQILAESASRVLPTGKLVVRFLSSRCPGIGKTRAQRLWDRFGDSLPAALKDDNLEHLAQIIDPARPILALRIAAYVVSSWKQAEAESSLTAWLQSYGVDDFSVVKLCADIFGINACNLLDKNPYRLSLLLPWVKCDAIGLKLLSEAKEGSKAFEAPQRLIGAIESAMRDVLSSGDTSISKENLLLILRQKLLTQRDFPEELANKALELGIQARALVKSGACYLPTGSAFMEQCIKNKLQDLKNAPELIFDQNKIDQIITDLSRNQNYPDAEQKYAILHAIHCSLSILVGSAGTGKTSTLRYIVHSWKRLGGNVLMCALAGKAALRLTQATGLTAKTIARTLRELNSDEDDDNNYDKLTINKKTLLVIDEASMVDIATMYNLLKHVVPGAKFLMCGDPAQLPPIGFGLCFHKLVADTHITTRLTQIYRQSDESGIPGVAAKIRQREVPDFREYTGIGHGVSFIDAPHDKIPDLVMSVAHDLGGFCGIDDLMVVSATNIGIAGISNLNKMFHFRHLEKLPDPKEIKGYLGQYFAQFSPIIHLKNDYKKNLYNGSLGIVKTIDVENHSLVAEFDKEEVEFDRSELIDIALSYAITCHKCQGSQFKRVIVPVYKTRVMDPSWIYTAITRATIQVVLVGSRDALCMALQRPFVLWDRVFLDTELGVERLPMR